MAVHNAGGASPSVPRLDESDPFHVMGLPGGRQGNTCHNRRRRRSAACQQRRDALCHCEREIAIAVRRFNPNHSTDIRALFRSFLLFLWPIFPFPLIRPSILPSGFHLNAN